MAGPLTSELPIIQAPMAGGPSTPRLTAAVADAGGYGFLAAGYLSADGLRQLMEATRSITGAPFGVNLFCPSAPADQDSVRAYAQAIHPEAVRLGVPLGEAGWEDDAYDAKVDVVASAHVDLVSFTFGCPTPATIDRLHRDSCRVAVTVTSAEEAGMAEAAGADLVVVQGTEAGGHQGSFLDLDPNVRPLASLLEDVRSSTRIPAVASGGIMTGTDALSILQMELSRSSWEPPSSVRRRPERQPPTAAPSWSGPIQTRSSPGHSAAGMPGGWPTSSLSGMAQPPPRRIPRSITSPGPCVWRRPRSAIPVPRICGPGKVGTVVPLRRHGRLCGGSPPRWHHNDR